MPDSKATTSELKGEQSAWAVPAGLAACFAAYNLVLSPMHQPVSDLSDWLAILGLGVVFVEPLLLAAWTAFGPGSIVYRLPISVVTLVAWIFAQTFVGWNLFVSDGVGSYLNVEMAAAFVVVFAVATIIMGIVRRFSRIQILRHAQSMSLPQLRQNQFGMKYLLGWMTVCPLLIVVGRSFISESFQFNQPWLSVLEEAAVVIAFLVLLLMPPVVLPILTLTRPMPWRIALAVVVLWPPLLWLAAKVVGKNAPAAPPPEFIWMLFVIQSGATVTALFCALVLRLAGFRLVSTVDFVSTPIADGPYRA